MKETLAQHLEGLGNAFYKMLSQAVAEGIGYSYEMAAHSETDLHKIRLSDGSYLYGPNHDLEALDFMSLWGVNQYQANGVPVYDRKTVANHLGLVARLRLAEAARTHKHPPATGLTLYPEVAGTMTGALETAYLSPQRYPAVNVAVVTRHPDGNYTTKVLHGTYQND